MKELISAIRELGQLGCIDYIQLLIAAAAALFAILVPYRVAHIQNKIALFEKRYSLYTEIEKCITGAKLLQFKGEVNDLKTTDFLMVKTFSDGWIKLNDVTEEKNSEIFSNVLNKLKQADFLYDKKSAQEITNLAGKLFYILVDIERENNHNIKVKEYIRQADVVEQQILPKIRIQLKLK